MEKWTKTVCKVTPLYSGEECSKTLCFTGLIFVTAIRLSHYFLFFFVFFFDTVSAPDIDIVKGINALLFVCRYAKKKKSKINKNNNSKKGWGTIDLMCKVESFRSSSLFNLPYTSRKKKQKLKSTFCFKTKNLCGGENVHQLFSDVSGAILPVTMAPSAVKMAAPTGKRLYGQ